MMAADPHIVSPYLNIPAELRSLQAWCCWRYQITPYGKTKVPYNPLTGRNAASNDPSTWCSFEQALAAVGSYDGIGFFFDKSFGYVGIDLDHTEDEKLLERHATIKLHSQSYAEYSPSGKGMHIICKGSIPRGVKSASKKIEMYDTGRFFTMTGNVYRNSLPTNEQAMLDFLFASISRVKDVEGLAVSPLDQPEIDDDVTIYNRASTASNGDKFLKLWNGEFSGLYGSASEADLALINIIAFYSRNFAQTERIFKFSVLGKREKSQRKDYVKPMIEKAFDRMPPTIEALMSMSSDFNKLLLSQKEAAESNSTSAPLAVSSHQSAASAAPGKGDNQVPPDESDTGGSALKSTPAHLLKPPPGLLGEVAAYIYQAAPRPVPHIALAGAIGLMAGICGKAFNISNTGLNQYVLLLAETGRGKEAMKAGIKSIINSMMMTNVTADKIIGAGKINSGQALRPYLANHPTRCFVSIQSEFDNTYSQMVSPNANGAMKELKSQYLDLYMASGANASTEESIYSDKDKGTGSVKSPAFSLLAECTLTHMNKILTEDQISDGLLTRFLNIVYDGPRVPINENQGTPPQLEMIKKLCALHAAACQKMGRNEVVTIKIDDEAKAVLDQLNVYCDKQMNMEGATTFYGLWNRVHLKALKLAGLLAASDYAHKTWEPVVTKEYAEWARDVVVHDVHNILSRFERHEVGDQTNENSQLRDMKKALMLYGKMTEKQKETARISPAMYKDGVFSYKWVTSRVFGLTSFKNDKGGATRAIDRTLRILEDNGTIYDIRKDPKSKDKYGTGARAYIFLDYASLNH